MMLLRILVLWLFLCYSYSKADICLPNTEGLCEPGVNITEDVQIEITEEDLGTEIVTTTTTTTTTTTQTVTNEDSGDILDGGSGYVSTSKEGDMDTDWGGQGPANMPSGNNCYALGSDKCAQITGSGNSTSTMGVSGMGTTFIQTVDISDLNIQKGGEVRYSIEVDKRDAQDRIYMHITGLNGSNQVFAGTDILSETGVASGYQSYDGSFDFGGILNKLTIEIGGRDINLAIGPLFDDVTVNVFYNVISTIIEQQITTVEQIYYLNIFDPTELEFAEEVFEFNDISFDDGDIDFTQIEAPTEEVTYETVELEIQEFEIDLPQTEIASVEVQAEMEIELELEMEMELDLPEPEVEETIEVAKVEESVDEQPTEETTEPDSETTEESAVEPEDSTEQEEVQQEEVEKPEKPVKEPSAKEKAATKIVKKIDDKARYDESNQMKTLIVMQILGNTKNFFDTQSTIQDTNVNEYLNKTLEDNYGVLFNIAQGQTMEEMINAQY
tara:strand:+ start:944 stop:2437 length:1494 start_codon:yes stop_codon:yes gene_type:complete